MKKLILLLLISISAIGARATHLMGGEVTVLQDANGLCHLTLTHYRDTLGIPLGVTEPIEIYSYDAVNNMYNYFTTLTVPLDVALSTSLLPSFPYGVEVGVYDDTITLPPGEYRISNTSCCRNGAILNMANPMGESMSLYTDYTVFSGSGNSTPNFLAMPVAYFPINDPANYNPLPYDADGDSLAWSLNTPINTVSGGSALVNVAGFVAPAADPSGPFTMNPITGEITWTPNMLGNFVQSFVVDEYRNGVKIGSIIRDMQYVIIPDSNNSTPFFQNITTVSNNTQQNYNYVYYTPAQQLVFEIRGSDINPGTVLEMDSYAEIFTLANPATFATTMNGNDIIGTLTWTPPSTFTKDVITVFRLRDGQFTRDYTLLLRKNPNPSGVHSVSTVLNEMAVFPNPAHNQLNLSLELSETINGDITLYAATGQKVKIIYNGKLLKGNYKMNEEINLPAGMYYLVARDNGKIVKTVKLTVQ